MPIRALLALLLLALNPAARAATLAEALEQAWARHPQAAAGSDLEAAARAERDLARRPTPGPATLSLAHLTDQAGSDRGRREWEVELAAPLWLPGQRAARQAEAEAAGAELTARRQALRLALAGELRAAWWQLAAARAERDLARRRLDTARALEMDVTRRWRAGELARVDANLARNERLAAEAEKLQAETALMETEGAWRALTGAPSPEALAPEDPARALPQPDHPELASLDRAARLAHARLRLASETRRDAPELALRWQRERGDGAEAYGNALGLKLSVPFGSEARFTRDTAAARAEAVRADAELTRARQVREVAAEQARRELAAAEQRLILARERQALLADNLALAEKAFALGESDLVTLLRTRAAAQEAEAQLARQGISRQAALSRLLQALGILP